MRRLYLSIVLFYMIPSFSFAQTDWCGYKPGPLTNLQTARITDDTNLVLNIPVVIHLVHEANPPPTASNFTDSEVHHLIKYLNESFSGGFALYPHQGNGGVNTKIQFVLATRAPDCSPSSGINHFDASAYIGYRTTGNLDPGLAEKILWPCDQYLNIMVLHHTPGGRSWATTAGYGCGSVFEGIVMNRFRFKAGHSTMVHEVGHYLGLRHTFQDGQNGCPPNDNCQLQGDGICDTEPHQEQATTYCSGIGSTNPCTGQPFGSTLNNFMSYSEHTCRDRFTPNQKQRMRNFIQLVRPTLINNINTKPFTYVNDLDPKTEITVGPNPSRGQLTVKFSRVVTGQAILRVITPEGKTVSTTPTHCLVSTVSLDLSHLPRGMYFLLFTDESGSVSKKVILQ